VRGWRSSRMEVAATIQCKTDDGGGAPVIGAGHTTRGRMGGLPGALKRQTFSRGKGNSNGCSVAPCRSRGVDGEERGVQSDVRWRREKGAAQRQRGGGAWPIVARKPPAQAVVDEQARRSLGVWVVVGRPAWVWPREQCLFYLFQKHQIDLNGFD
jgi:hypothetical protein